MKIIIVLGPAGSGKGTQVNLLVKKFHLDCFGSGVALRERARKRDFTGKRVHNVMKGGALVPSFIISKLWMDVLEKFRNRKSFRGAVFDGTPRKLGEAEFFNEALSWYGWDDNVRVIYINISEKESFDRLTKRRMCKKCGNIIPWIGEFKNMERCNKCNGQLMERNDDKPAAIEKRMEEFRYEVLPVLNIYRKQGRLIEVNGEQSIEKVFKEICDKLKA